jgi:hypothetical protein
MNARRGKLTVRDAHYGDLEHRVIRQGGVQGVQREHGHGIGCKQTAKLHRRYCLLEVTSRNNDLHTEMIMAKDRKRAMSVFRVLEFAVIERTMERNGWRRAMKHVQAPILEDKKSLNQNTKHAGGEAIQWDGLSCCS